MIDWKLVENLIELCDRAGVSFDLCYTECEHNWYVAIRSAAPAERYVGCDGPFEFVLNSAIRWVEQFV
jgi:hypothetical protein